MHWDDNWGNWQGLDSSDQLPRYLHLAKLIGVGSVLDVGCGEGLLRNFLDCEYLGVEPSAKAANGKSYIVCATAEDFETERHFDCVVFNEVLYYSNNPLYLLRKFGVIADRIVISIYQSPQRVSIKKRVLNALDPTYPTSNINCSKIIDEYFEEQKWKVLSRELVSNQWRMWVIEPHRGITRTLTALPTDACAVTA